MNEKPPEGPLVCVDEHLIGHVAVGLTSGALGSVGINSWRSVNPIKPDAGDGRWVCLLGRAIKAV